MYKSHKTSTIISGEREICKVLKYHHSSACLRAAVQSQRSGRVTWRPTSKRPSAADCWGRLFAVQWLDGKILCRCLQKKKSLGCLTEVLAGVTKVHRAEFCLVLWNHHVGFLTIMVVTVYCFQVRWTFVFLPRAVGGDGSFHTRFLLVLWEEDDAWCLLLLASDSSSLPCCQSTV